MSHLNGKTFDTDIDITEHLSNVSYAKIVIQMIKYLLFSRGQIPFTYETLKILINKYDNLIENDESKNILKKQRHKQAASIVKALDRTFDHLVSECSSNQINEVAVLFGGTPVTPKEVFYIKWSSCGYQELKEVKRQDAVILNILRDLITCSDLQRFTANLLPITNVFILVKKPQNNSIVEDFFLPKDNYSISERPLQYNINLIHTSNCSLRVYNPTTELTKTNFCILETSNLDLKDISDEDEISSIGITDNDYKMIRKKLSEKLKDSPKLIWFQSKEIVKGFKDEAINGQSIWK